MQPPEQTYTWEELLQCRERGALSGIRQPGGEPPAPAGLQCRERGALSGMPMRPPIWAGVIVLQCRERGALSGIRAVEPGGLLAILPSM